MLIKTVLISLVFTTAILFNACSSEPLNKTPKCSDLAIIKTLTNILNTDNKKAIVDIATVRKKIDLTEQHGMKTCRCIVEYVYTTNAVSKSSKVFYTVIMNEKDEKYIVNVIEE